MTRTMKRAVSVILALAMVVTSLSYTPKTVEAAEGDLTFTELKLDGQDTIWYAIKDQAFNGWGNPFYGDGGITLMFGYSADVGTVKVTIDGEEKTVENSDGLITEIFAAGIKFNPQKLPKTGRTEITLTDASETSMSLVITKEDPTGTTEPVEPTDQTDPVEPTDQTDPVEPTLDWQTNTNLTAVLGEGTKYAVDGSADGIDYFIEETGIRFLGGGFGTGAIITLNGKEVYNGGYAIPNYTINYSELSAGENIIELTADYNYNEVQKTCNLKLYINTPARPINVFVRDYVKYTGKYVFKFGEVDGATIYNVYVDDNATPVATVGGSGDYITASELTGITAGEHNFYLTAVVSKEDGTSEETIKSEAIPFTYSEQVGDNNEIAQIYVQTDDLTKDAMSFDKNRDGKVSSAITIVDKDGKTSDIFEDKTKTTIKVRGNSTANAQKKAFNISFSKAKNVFGFGNAKKWCLLANAFDKTLIRNKLAMDFALNVMGLNETGNSQYIDLYLNGVYMGNYLLIEAVEVGESRVNIQSESVNSNDILIELEGLGPNGNGKVEDGVRYITTNGITGNNDQVHFNIGSPENGDGIDGTGVDGEMTEEELKAKDDYAVQFLNQFEQDLANDDYTAYSQYVDMKSFVDFYIVNELFKNKDFSYSSTRFYIKDNKLYAGPLWDLDLSSGNVKDENGWTATESPLYCQDMPWFKALMKNETFAEAVAQRFAEVKEEAVALYSGDNNKIDALVGENGEIIASARRNYAATEDGGAGWSETAADPSDGYSNASSGKNFEESVEWLRTWLGQRTDYLSRLWIGNNEAPDYSNINVADDDWTLVGADADGNKWYYATSYRVAMGGSGYAVLIDNPGADGYGDGDANTIKSAALGLGAGENARTADSVWFNDTKLAANSETYYQSTTANDVLFFAQSLFEVGKISYITVRAADGNDYILPVKVEAEKAPENNADLTKGWTKLPVKYDNNHTIDDLAYDYYINTAIWGNGVNVNESSVCVSHTATGYHVNVADTCKLADNANSLTLYLNTWNLSTAWIDGTKYTFGDGNYAGGNSDTHEFALDLFDLGTHYVTLLNTNGEVVYDFAIKAVEKDADPDVDPDTISPMENVPEEVANAEWKSIGENTGFYYYDPEHIEGQANGTVQATSIEGTLMTIGTWVSALVTAKIGDVSFDKVKDSAQLTISTTLFKKDGIYQVDVDDNGTAHTFYIKKETPADYTATNVTVTDVTATGATISWTPSQAANDEAYTYKVLIDEVEVGTAINATYTYEADLSDGATHKVVIQTVDGEGNVVATSEEVTFKYSDEPDYYDVALEKVEITGEFTVGSTITMTATIKNVGKALTITNNDNPKLVLQFMKNVDVENNQYGENGENLVDGDWYEIIDYNSQNSTLKTGSVLAYGDTFTYTWTRTVQQGLIDLIESAGNIDFRVNPEGGAITPDATQEINGVRTFKNNYYSYVVTAPVENPKNVTATLNDNNGIDVTWKAPDEENTYTYEVWLNGVKVAEQINDTNYTISDDVVDGVNTVTVKAVLDEKASSGASAKVFNYTIDDANWNNWTYPQSNTDINGNTWEYYNGYGWNKLNMNAGEPWVGLYNNGATGGAATGGSFDSEPIVEIPVTGEAVINSVTINGIEYPIGINNDVYTIVDRVYIKQSLFNLGSREDKKVFALIFSGTNSGDTAVLVRVTNNNLEQFNFENVEGTDVATWNAVDDAASYQITYTVDGEEKTATITDLTDLSYTFRDGDTNIYPDNDTDVTIKAFDADGNEIEGSTKSVKARADLEITNVGTPDGAIIGENPTITVSYINKGTARATLTRDDFYAIKVVGAGNWYQSTDFLAPNETATAQFEVVGLNLTEGYNDLQVEIDEGNRVTESDETNNIKDFQLFAVSANAVKIEYDDAQTTGFFVKATWNKIEGATGYHFTYMSNGIEITNIIDMTAAYLKETADGTQYYCGVGSAIDTGTTFKVYATLANGEEVLVGVQEAKADLIVSEVSTPDTTRVGYPFSVQVSIKNVGTGQVRPKPADASFEEGYANYTIAAAVTWVDENGKNQWIVNDGYTDGIAAGFTVVRDLSGINPSVAGEQEFTYWADHYGNNENDNVVEFINESDETNNTMVKTYTVEERRQNTDMDWTRLVSADAGWAPVGTDYLFPVASGSQNAYIDYKVIDTNITDWDYDQIVERYVGYAGSNMTIAFNNYGGQYVTYEDQGATSKTRLDFAQIPGYTVDNDAQIATGIESAKWIQLATQNCTVYDEEGNPIAPIAGESPVSYNGNGINFFVGNFGLLKYYAMRFTTPTVNSETGETEDKYITLAFRVTDDNQHTGAWQQALESDNISNPNTLPVYYCGADTENPKYNDQTGHEETEGISLYETTGALWYDARDILLSSISVYNGCWLSVATSQYLQFDKGGQDGKNIKYRVGIARADFAENTAYTPAKDEDFVIIDPNKENTHIGIQGTNTIHIGLPWLLEKLPVHSVKGGEKDQEFYWLRIYGDYENKIEEDADHLANYVDIPIAIYADIPEIQKPQNVTAQTITDDEDQSQVMVSWSSLPEQDVYGYKYAVYIGDTKILPETGYYTEGEVVSFNPDEYSEQLTTAGNKVTVKAYWCEQETSVDVEIQAAKQAGWYPIEGDDTIGIQAGNSQPTDMPGTISYYYNVKENHASAVVGYNGDYISFNGNTKYFNENSKVSVSNAFKSRTDVETAKNTPEQFEFKEVEEFNYFEGQLQIIAKNLMTAHHETTCYLVKVETPVEGSETPNVTYLMLESIVKTESDVAIRGFQMNTDATPGAVSEKGPSFRVVSRASRIATVLADGDTEDNKSIQAIVAQGTMYALKNKVSDEDMEVIYDAENGKVTTTSENVMQLQATSLENKGGLFTGWEGLEEGEDENAYNYYAVTFKSNNATVSTLLAEYAVKAYAVAEDGTVIYEKETDDNKAVKTASINAIAKQLYDNSLMPTEMAHNYLYDNVLNVVAISQNRTSIVNSMLRTLNVTSKEEDNYKYLNTLNKDLYYYTYLTGEYKYGSYVDRGAFVSKTKIDGVENDVLLVAVLNAHSSSTYKTVADWIYANIASGLYTKVTYNPSAGSVDVVRGTN